MFGDDYQLPAMGKPGATSIPFISTKSTKGHHDMTQNQGALQFITLAEQVMTRLCIREKTSNISRDS
jgi:hypothetical protein